MTLSCLPCDIGKLSLKWWFLILSFEILRVESRTYAKGVIICLTSFTSMFRDPLSFLLVMVVSFLISELLGVVFVRRGKWVEFPLLRPCPFNSERSVQFFLTPFETRSR